MKTLDQICLSITPVCDKDSQHHNYTPHYEEVFAPIRELPLKFLEIGVEFGLSVRMWLEYFPNAQIFGVDINDNQIPHHERFTFIQGDQRSPAFWISFISKYGKDWDVILDDGSHKSDGIIPSFEMLWPYLKSNGLYLVEDLMCSYYPSCQVPGWPKAMDYIKGILDDINAQTSYYNTPERRDFSPGVVPNRGILWARFSEELLILKKK